jgi:3-methyladenine DNA glycosylase AlkD
MQLQDILDQLKAQANPENVAGMARFGINPENTLGISVNTLREMAKPLKRNHELALQLWETGIHEARMLATIIDDPKKVTEAQLESWVAAIDSWDICDGCCMNLFRLTPYAHAKALEWSERDEEFIKRAGFVLMATLAVHDKKAADSVFTPYLERIERHADDERNFVKKAVNWALRQIGKRNAALNQAAVETARRIEAQDSKAAKWVAKDALKELTGEAVRKKLKR